MTMTITRDELEAAIRSGDVLIVDALPASYYTQQHLPGAVNLVVEEVSDRAGQLLPDKDALIVTYCSNAACSNSTHVAARLEGIGYTNVRKYAEGIQDWVAAGLRTESSPAAASR